MSMYECDRCGGAVGLFCTCHKPLNAVERKEENQRLKAALAQVFGWNQPNAATAKEQK